MNAFDMVRTTGYQGCPVFWCSTDVYHFTLYWDKYPRHWLDRSDFQQFVDSLKGREVPTGKTAFQDNYFRMERLVKKQLPQHRLNRRVWTGELAE